MLRATGLCLATAAILLAGCGGNQQAAPTQPPVTPVTTAPATTTPTTTEAQPMVTSAADLAACNELLRNLRIVSGLTSSSTGALMQSLHPKELAVRVGQTRLSLLYSAKVMALIDVPQQLVAAKVQFVKGLRQFAKDYGAAQKLTAKGDLAGAARQLADHAALERIDLATRQFSKVCEGKTIQ